jgi:ADP-ribosylglycohydrolase
MELYFSNAKLKHNLNQAYRLHSIIPKEDDDRVRFSAIFQEMENSKEFSPGKLALDLRQSRGVAAVLGMGIGDALGSCTEFHHFEKAGLGIVKSGFEDLRKLNRSGKVSVWTDDASMGLCMADSILLNDYVFNPAHMRYLFVLWLEHGLNNGGRPYSIGLGGNISISMYEFMREQQQYTREGDRFNNGNGSLMRLAPVPVAYAHSPQEGVDYCGKQSLTTHNGLEAEECARLMGSIIIELINRAPDADGKETILRVCDGFKSPAESVVFLARGQQESEEYYEACCSQNPKFRGFNREIGDRNWNWRSSDHTYAPTRLKQQPGYIGSYCMDALAMALHTVITSHSFA